MTETKKSYSVKEVAAMNDVTEACVYLIIKRLAILPPKSHRISLDEEQAERVKGAIRRPKKVAVKATP